MSNVNFALFILSVLIIISPISVSGRLTIVAITEGETNQLLHARYINASAQFIKNVNYSRSLDYQQIDVQPDDVEDVINKICEQIESDNRTAFFISLARSTSVIETVKTALASMSIPTMQINYKPWSPTKNAGSQNVENPKSYATFTPPDAVFINVLPDLLKKLALTGSIVVLHDEFHTMETKYTNAFFNTPLNVIFMQFQLNESSINEQLDKFQSENIVNIVIMASINNAQLFFLNVYDGYINNGTFKWFIVTKDPNPYLCQACLVKNVLWVRPDMNMSYEPFQDFQDEVINPITINMTNILIPADKMILAFYFDLVYLANRSMLDFQQEVSNFPTFSCEFSNDTNSTIEDIYLLNDAIQYEQHSGTFGRYVMDSSKNFYQNVQVTIGNIYDDTELTRYIKTVAKWNVTDGLKLTNTEMFGDFSQSTFYKIAIVVQPPFIERYKNSEGDIKYRGYCIELIKQLSQMVGFTYQFYEVADQKYGLLNSRGDWNGLIRELVYGDADMALGTVRISSEIDSYADITVPFHEPVGHLILLLNSQSTNGYFEFMEVLTPNVWYCIVAAFFVTAFFLFIFDKYCPYGKHEKKKITYTQSMWYCLTSLIPQGGPDAPKNTSCKVVAATWWIFGFIIISAYTANLAAYLTLTKMQTMTMTSLNDLSMQTMYRYGALRGTEAEEYFRRMKDTEKSIWKLETMPMTLSPSSRASLAVWDYPVSDKYTNMWRFMTDYNFTLLPKTVEQALEWVLATTSDNGFAYIGEATHIKYIAMTDCRFEVVGEEFNKKPYGIAFQQKFRFKSDFNREIIELTRNGWLPNLKETWWNNYPNCSSSTSNDNGSGISVTNILGLFLVVGGLLIACVVTLIIEFLYYEEKLCVRRYREHHPPKHSKEPDLNDTTKGAVPSNVYDVQRIDPKNISYIEGH